MIAGALGAVGPKPDLVFSGINHGVNVGRSVLHSGTVGAALTASQLGISALAVSLRVGDEPDPWESAADLAVALIPMLAAAPARTVLNLNVPHLPPEEIRGVRWARVSGAGLIKSARGSGSWEAPNREEIEGPAAAEAARSIMEGEPEEKGQIVLTVGSPFPHSSDLGLADAGSEDATLVAQGYAALTALRGPRADEDPELLGRLDQEPGCRAVAVRLQRLSSTISVLVGPRRPPCPLGLGAVALLLHPAHLRALRRPGGATGSLVAQPRIQFRRQPLERQLAVARLGARLRCARRARSGPRRSSSRARWRGPSVTERSTSNCTSTRLRVRFACWPPGPPDVVARHEISASGRSSPRRTCSVSSPATRRA